MGRGLRDDLRPAVEEEERDGADDRGSQQRAQIRDEAKQVGDDVPENRQGHAERDHRDRRAAADARADHRHRAHVARHLPFDRVEAVANAARTPRRSISDCGRSGEG